MEGVDQGYSRVYRQPHLWLCAIIGLCILIRGTVSVPAPVYGLESIANAKSTKTSVENGDYIVVFKNHSCDMDRITQTWRHQYNPGGDDGHFKWHKAFRFAKFAAARLSLNSTTLRSLRDDPEVKYIEVNREIRVNQDTPPPCSSQEYGSCKRQSTGSTLWGLSRTNMRTLSSFSSAKFEFLDGDGIGVEVYVVDTGVYPEHNEFEGRAKAAFVSSEHAAEGPNDLHGHGTHVSGTIGGKTYGLAKKAKIIGVKVLGKNGIGTLGGLLEGLQWVDQDFQAKKSTAGNKAKAVVNLSLGGSPGEITSLDEAAITLISEGGLPFVIAAGNDNTDACSVSPGRVSIAITAGATNQKDILSTFSNYGPCVDILAPGEMVLSAYIGSPSTSAIMSGTSMSTPHVTGVVARYLSQACEGAPSPAAIKAWLLDVSTTTVVDLKTKLSTPNRLLYMSCVAGAGSAIPGGPDSNFTTGYNSDHFMYIYIGLGVVGILCLIVLTFTCVTYRKVKDVQHAQARPVRQYYQPTYQTFAQPGTSDACHPTA